MKEFIEKLIERLEDCTQVVHYGEVFIFLEEAEEIINQLAEEYSHRTEDLVIGDSLRIIDVSELLREE